MNYLLKLEFTNLPPLRRPSKLTNYPVCRRCNFAGSALLLPEVRERSPDAAPNQAAPGLLPRSMVLGHRPIVATATIDEGRRLFQRQVGGGGIQTDHHLV